MFVKDETVQHGGSFKYRGAILGVANAQCGVVAAGAGNFPIAVGLASQQLGKAACLFVPDDIPPSKLRLVHETGAELCMVPRSETIASAQAEAEKRGWRILHAFEDDEMLAESFSLGLEIADAIEQDQDGAASDAVIVACGGGGLAACVAAAIRARGLNGRIYVAEPESHRRLAAAREAGTPFTLESPGETVCDALRVRGIGTRAPLRFCKRLTFRRAPFQTTW